MNKRIEVIDEEVVVTLRGSMFLEDSTELRKNIVNQIDRHNATIVVDLTELYFIDSAGLGMLICLHRRATQYGGSVILKGPTGFVKEIIDVTRLNNVFEIRQ